MKRALLLLFGFVVTHALLQGATGELRLISHNVFNGFTTKPEPRHTQWRAWMARQQPDVVALQELNGYTPEKLAGEARAWGHEYSVLLKEGGFPTGLTSRTPISNVARLRDGFHHGLLRAETRGLVFYVVHFHPSNFERRIAEAELLRKDLAALPADGRRIVLVGDFNGFSPQDRTHYETDVRLEPFLTGLDRKTPTARNLNRGKLDYGGIQAILDQGFIDAIARFRTAGAPYTGTFPSPLMSEEEHGTDRRIDYIMVSANLLSAVGDARILRDDVTARLSDHYPLRADLRLAP